MASLYVVTKHFVETDTVDSSLAGLEFGNDAEQFVDLNLQNVSMFMFFVCLLGRGCMRVCSVGWCECDCIVL